MKYGVMHDEATAEQAVKEAGFFLDEEPSTTLAGMAKNARLGSRGARPLTRARARAKRTAQSIACFGETLVACKRKGGPRRVIYKVEVVSLAGRIPRDDRRFADTDLPRRPEAIYDPARKSGLTRGS
jgi:hypothetical protein